MVVSEARKKTKKEIISRKIKASLTATEIDDIPVLAAEVYMGFTSTYKAKVVAGTMLNMLNDPMVTYGEDRIKEHVTAIIRILDEN